MPQPDPAAFGEPFRNTLLRTASIAVVLGAALAGRFGGITQWPSATLLMLWPSLGGHFVELCFLNILRPRIPASLGMQTAGRILTWFIGGIVLALGMRFTAGALNRFAGIQRTTWWIAGLGFIVIELLVHLMMKMRGRTNFYDGRG